MPSHRDFPSHGIERHIRDSIVAIFMLGSSIRDSPWHSWWLDRTWWSFDPMRGMRSRNQVREAGRTQGSRWTACRSYPRRRCANLNWTDDGA